MLAYLLYPIRLLIWALGNLTCRLRRPPDYVMFILDGEYPMIRQPSGNLIMRWLRPPRLSLQELAEQFHTVAADRRVRGVILNIRQLSMPMAHLDSLRDMIKDLRAANKRVVVWSNHYNNTLYYLACAADDILIAPGGLVDSLGLRRQYIYLADALSQIGLQVDVVPISAYKSAADMFTRNSMSEEVRAMANWLADSTYGEIVRGVAEGRHVNEETARALIDQTPCTDTTAQQLGLINAIATEEDLPTYVRGKQKAIRLATWQVARLSLLRRPPLPTQRYIALLSIEGSIVDGYSEHPPFKLPIPFVFNDRAGDLSVVQAARQVLADPRAAAVVVYVDSGGGSATASEAMRAALIKVAAKKPLIVAMGAVAASGGYWVSTPGSVIIAQPNTITGSIGVLFGKIFNAGLMQKLLVNQETISRGKGAPLTDPERPFSEEERAKIRMAIEEIYDMFLERVAASRKMTREAVHVIGAGRVWTGRQALANGLVDDMGGLWQATAKARELAHLDERVPVHVIHPERQYIAPLPDTAAALAYAMKSVHLFNSHGVLCLCPWLWYEKGWPE